MSQQTQRYQQLIAKCWADETFKQRLLADPAGTLKAEGFALPEGVTVTAVEDTAQHFTLVIPHRPTELSDAALEGVSGGVQWIVLDGPVTGMELMTLLVTNQNLIVAPIIPPFQPVSISPEIMQAAEHFVLRGR